jgi:hypothetical protein
MCAHGGGCTRNKGPACFHVREVARRVFTPGWWPGVYSHRANGTAVCCTAEVSPRADSAPGGSHRGRLVRGERLPVDTEVHMDRRTPKGEPWTLWQTGPSSGKSRPPWSTEKRTDGERHSVRKGWALPLVGLAVLVLLMAIGLRPISEELKWRWYRSFRGGDPAIAAGERSAQLKAIAESLRRYRDSHDAYPEGLESWRAFEPEVRTLLARPRWSIRGDYVIRFERLASDRVQLLVEDPGFDWPGDPAKDGRTPDRLQRSRCGLTTDLQLVRYSLKDGELQFLDEYWSSRVVLDAPGH